MSCIRESSFSENEQIRKLILLLKQAEQHIASEQAESALTITSDLLSKCASNATLATTEMQPLSHCSLLYELYILQGSALHKLQNELPKTTQFKLFAAEAGRKVLAKNHTFNPQNTSQFLEQALYSFQSAYSINNHDPRASQGMRTCLYELLQNQETARHYTKQLEVVIRTRGLLAPSQVTQQQILTQEFCNLANLASNEQLAFCQPEAHSSINYLMLTICIGLFAALAATLCYCRQRNRAAAAMPLQPPAHQPNPATQQAARRQNRLRRMLAWNATT